MPENKKHFLKATLLIAVFSLLSRILGLLRSTLLASFYGASGSDGLNDCYTAAFKLPDIIFNLVAAGAISIVLIPYFTGLIKKDDKTKLNEACSSFLNFFFLMMAFFVLLAYIFAPFFVKQFLVSGWTNEHNILLTIKMTRILLLQVLFMTLSGIFGSYLNAIEKFTAYSFALLSYNVGIIAGILFLTPLIGIEGVVWGVVAGSFIHFSIQGTGAFVNGFRFRFCLPKLNKEIRDLFLVAIPRIIAISGDQITRFFLVNFASFIFVGSMFIFDNVENLAMVAYGMIAVSLSTTAFPVFVKLYNEKDFDGLILSLFEKLRSLMFLMLPATVLMIIFRTEIIEILLGYGKFQGNNITLTSDALLYYMIGIPFLSITILTVKYYYAQKKSLIPMIIALISIAVTLITSFYFSKIFAVSGLSIGRSLGFIIQALLLLGFIIIINKKEKIISSFPKKPFFDTLKIITASIFMLASALILQHFIKFSGNIKFISILNIIIIGGISSIIYVLSSLLFKVPEITFFYNKIIKR
jgi:putative peptidoglycan lipid II flippase